MENHYRVVNTGKVITESEFRQMLDRMNIMPPSILTMRDLREHGVEPVLHSMPPPHAMNQVARMQGIRMNAMNQWEHAWVVEDLPESEARAQLNLYIKEATKKIDDSVAAVYAKHSRFQLEYQLREQAAKEYFLTGQESGDIARLAANMRVAIDDAAGLVIAQAKNFYSALTALGALRMDKYLIVHSTSLEEAQGHYTRIITQVNRIAESLS